MPAENEKYTFADYLTWDSPERYELVDGEAVMLAAPRPTHQEISGAIYAQIWNYLEGKKNAKPTLRPLTCAFLSGRGTAPRTWIPWSSPTSPWSATSQR